MKDQKSPGAPSAPQTSNPIYPCVETGIWTPIPKPPPKGDLRITLKSIDSEQSRRVKSTNRLTFHAIGCSGRYEQCPDGPQPGTVVANALAKQATDAAVYNGYSSADPASFLFHLGDVVYKAESVNNSVAAVDPDQSEMYDIEFYRQYASYEPEILSIPGNHDSKWSKHSERSAIDHYLINFCDSDHRKSLITPVIRRERR